MIPAALHALSHPTVDPLEQHLPPGFQFQRRHQAGDRHDRGIGEAMSQSGEPALVDHYIVIGEGNDVMAGLGNPAVTRPVEARWLSRM